MRNRKPLIMALAALIGFSACGSSGIPEDPDPAKSIPGESDPATFTSALELQKALVDAKKASAEQTFALGEGGMPPVAAAGEAPTPGPANGEITNNQEQGVDEGGIVKNIGAYLVILRRGRLVSVRADGGETLPRVDLKEVRPAGLSSDVWYDELIVKGDHVVVIGYRWGSLDDGGYNFGGTELNFFKLTPEGLLARGATYMIESGDYFSWSNYTGRLAGGRLLFYSPFYGNMLLTEREELRLPRLLKLDERGQWRSLGHLFEATDVMKGTPVLWPTLHAVTFCEMENLPDLRCKTKVVMASPGHEYYVSETGVYLWVETVDGRCAGQDDRCLSPAVLLPPSRLYRFDLNGLETSHVSLSVRPFDQFSFSEQEGELDMVGYPIGEAPTPCGVRVRATEWWEKAEYWSIPLSDFGRSGSSGYPNTQPVCLPDGWPSAQRFTETHYAYASGSHLKLLDRRSRQLTTLAAGGPIRRIERAGSDLITFGLFDAGIDVATTGSMEIRLVQLGNNPTFRATQLIQNVSGEERRSHGFSFHDGEAFDSFGLATMTTLMTGACEPHPSTGDVVCWDAVVDVPTVSVFNIVNGTIEHAGDLVSRPFNQPDGDCTTSCIDWYGSSRPIFLGGRIMGLMGDQLSLGSLDANRALKPGVDLDLLGP